MSLAAREQHQRTVLSRESCWRKGLARRGKLTHQVRQQARGLSLSSYPGLDERTESKPNLQYASYNADPLLNQVTQNLLAGSLSKRSRLSSEPLPSNSASARKKSRFVEHFDSIKRTDAAKIAHLEAQVNSLKKEVRTVLDSDRKISNLSLYGHSYTQRKIWSSMFTLPLLHHHNLRALTAIGHRSIDR